jgi:hypothetical protein
MTAAINIAEHTPDADLHRDLKTLAKFVRIYCQGRHQDRQKQPAALKTHDVERLVGGPVELCGPCTKLLTHALVKRTACPMRPKPACKHCPQHCYHPTYRAQIRKVMKYSGRKLVLRGRLDLLIHLLF